MIQRDQGAIREGPEPIPELKNSKKCIEKQPNLKRNDAKNTKIELKPNERIIKRIIQAKAKCDMFQQFDRYIHPPSESNMNYLEIPVNNGNPPPPPPPPPTQ